MDGTWDKILTRLQVDADAAGELDWTVSVDSTVVRVHQHGATAAGRATVTAAGPRTLPGGSIELQESP